ncbi:MAG TPA: hypothetical protein DEQ30_02655 [Porphyromonadaceae bacterium]|nr:hypothetical protein [Porphyromonadaceae bacterium]
MKKKILIIGGTGIAGKCILEYLSSFPHLCEITTGSRGNQMIDKKIEHVMIDISKAKEYESVIKQFDIIILASGPFSNAGTEIYKLCLKYDVICIDINDDYTHCESVLEIKNKEEFSQKGTVFTGMGLCPGLTTYMLKYAALHLGESPLEAQLRIYFGAGVASGIASINNMFEGFKHDPFILTNRNHQRVNTSRYQKGVTFTFDGKHQNMPLIFFSSPEVLTLRQDPLFYRLLDFDAAFHLQHFSKGLAPILRYSSKMRKWFCKLALKKQNQLDRNSMNEKSVLISTIVKGENSCKKSSLQFESSFKLTGIFSTIITILVLEGKIPICPGIFCLEDISIDLKLINEKLKKFGVNIFIK